MKVLEDFLGPPPSTDKTTLIIKVSKGAKIRNRYNQVPHLTQDTNGKVTSLQYYCILGLIEIKTLHPRDKIMRKKMQDEQVTKSHLHQSNMADMFL